MKYARILMLLVLFQPAIAIAASYSAVRVTLPWEAKDIPDGKASVTCELIDSQCAILDSKSKSISTKTNGTSSGRSVFFFTGATLKQAAGAVCRIHTDGVNGDARALTSKALQGMQLQCAFASGSEGQMAKVQAGSGMNVYLPDQPKTTVNGLNLSTETEKMSPAIAGKTSGLVIDGKTAPAGDAINLRHTGNESASIDLNKTKADPFKRAPEKAQGLPVCKPAGALSPLAQGNMRPGIDCRPPTSANVKGNDSDLQGNPNDSGPVLAILRFEPVTSVFGQNERVKIDAQWRYGKKVILYERSGSKRKQLRTLNASPASQRIDLGLLAAGKHSFELVVTGAPGGKLQSASKLADLQVSSNSVIRLNSKVGGGSVVLDLGRLSWRGATTIKRRVNVPQLKLIGIGSRTQDVHVPQLKLIGIGSRTQDVHVPQLKLIGIGSRTQDVYVPQLKLIGIGSRTQDVNVPQLKLIGIGSRTQDVNVPQLKLIGIGSRRQDVDVPQLKLIGIGSRTQDVNVPQLKLIGIGSRTQNVNAPQLKLMGTNR